MLKKKYNLLNLVILSIFFFTGLSITKDYGISYDELEYRQQGFVVLNEIGNKFFPDKIEEIKREKNLEYPSPSEYMGDRKNNFKIHHTLFAAIEFVFFKKSEKKNVYLMRHYVNFTMSVLMVIFFYNLIKLNFSRELALIGSTILILNPKIFPDYIYNPNDIWFSFFLVLSSYCSLKFFKKKKINIFFDFASCSFVGNKCENYWYLYLFNFFNYLFTKML